MRSRRDINEEVLESNAEKNVQETVRLLILEVLLEVLLDIRDQNAEIVSLLQDVTTNRRQVSVRGNGDL